MRLTLHTLGVAAVWTWAGFAAAEAFPEFKTHDINPEAGTGLAITVADIQGDGKPDIVGVSSSDVYWYENPSWTPHLITERIKGSNVCVAPQDIDGDGLPELALGADWQYNNTTGGGALYLLRQGADPTEPWTVQTLLEEEPTLHRIQWADLQGDDAPELVVAPLKGIGTTGPNFDEAGVHLFALRPPNDPFADPWTPETIDKSLHVLHNIWPVPAGVGEKEAILAASFEGITKFIRNRDGSYTKQTLVEGNPKPVPEGGAGEIKRSTSDPSMLATIEPWHGHQAVVYTPRVNGIGWDRHVIDDTLAGGHAVWWADFDGDGADEVVIGYRQKAGPEELPGLNVYDLRFDNETGAFDAEKHVIDRGGMATEDARAADMNGDGRPDIVAFGRATHNVRYYENLGAE